MELTYNLYTNKLNDEQFVIVFFHRFKANSV